MANREKYNKIFMESFSLEEAQLGQKLAYNEVPAWDSIGHMTLMSAFEEGFGIAIETDDIINFSSYDKGFEILSKYGVQF